MLNYAPHPPIRLLGMVLSYLCNKRNTLLEACVFAGTDPRILTSAPYEGEWLASRPGHFIPGEKALLSIIRFIIINVTISGLTNDTIHQYETYVYK